MRYLITGGARSGKSTFAEKLATELGEPVLYVATAEALDDEMRQRVNNHRSQRSQTWKILEAFRDVGNSIMADAETANVVLVDCITMLVNAVFNRFAEMSPDSAKLGEAVMAEIGGLLTCSRNCRAHFIMVTNEIGLGLVPADPVSRLYRDLLGKANQVLAADCEVVYCMISGLAVKIKPQH